MSIDRYMRSIAATKGCTKQLKCAAIDKAIDLRQIVRLVLWSTPEVQELRAAWLIHIKRRLSIKLKRPIFKAKTVLDLLVTICDIRMQLLNAKLISLLLMYFTSILTSLISRALLQVALDKEAGHLSREPVHSEF
jgi:hypothetical protein